MPAPRSVQAGPVSLSRCACCQPSSPASWTSSAPTPRAPNLCPSSAYSTSIDLCLGPLASDWQDHSANCSDLLQGSRVAEVAGYLEQSCHCGISALYLQGFQLWCVSGWLRVRGSMMALSSHQQNLIQLTSSSHLPPPHGEAGCPDTSADPHTGQESALRLQVGLGLGLLALLGLGAALVLYLYKKRRPLNYHSMELSEHKESEF